MSKLPIEECYDVERYLDGLWYVVSAIFPAEEKLVLGPFKSEATAWHWYHQILIDFYTED